MFVSEAQNSTLPVRDEVQSILATLEDYSEILYSQGRSIQPYSSVSIRKLLSYTEQERVAFRARFKRFSILMTDAQDDEEVGHGDDRYFMELCAERLGLIFDKGVYDTLKPGDVVEIYNLDMIQVFRNFAFFDVCSYSLLDLLTHEFFELYERSQLVNQYLFDAASKLHTRAFSLAPEALGHVPMHLLQEKFSEGKLTSLVKFKWVYPVYTWPQTLFGYLVVQEGEVLKELPQTQLAFI